jgi:hypothetical protein
MREAAPPLSRDELRHIVGAAIIDEIQRWDDEGRRLPPPVGQLAVDALHEAGALAIADCDRPCCASRT